ncbi:hypothetical protein CEQ90_07880 [Lewinellaceae bacterium SD302]|nr:hypothetical protein CEQ90_07880 [Lewinellaceae bacterium SD302]
MGLEISKRRIAAIVISMVMIVAIAFATFVDPEDSDTLILAFLGLFFLGVFQLLSAVAGLVRGSKIQGGYLLASVIFLIYYVGCVAGYFTAPELGIDETYLGVIASLTMAICYVLILVFDRARPERIILKPEDDLLDDF